MDNENEVLDFLAGTWESIEGWLSAGESEGMVFSRLKGMRTTLFEWTAEVDELTRHAISKVAANMVAEGRPLPASTVDAPTKSSVDPIIDTPNPATNLMASAKAGRVRKKKPPLKVKLYFYGLADDRLSLNERIIFSLLCKWANGRKKRSPVKPKHIERFTRFRPASIAQSLQRLTNYGYIDGNFVPLATKDKEELPVLANGVEVKMFRKLSWLNDGNVRWQVIHGVIRTSRPKQQRPAWLVKTLGVARATAFRHLKEARGSTDETSGRTDEMAVRNQ